MADPKNTQKPPEAPSKAEAAQAPEVKPSPELLALRKENEDLRARVDEIMFDAENEVQRLKIENAMLQAAAARVGAKKRLYTGKVRLKQPHFRDSVLVKAGSVIELDNEPLGRQMVPLEEEAEEAPKPAPKKPAGRVSDKSVG